jgi:hypothetical protein
VETPINKAAASSVAPARLVDALPGKESKAVIFGSFAFLLVSEGRSWKNPGGLRMSRVVWKFD